MGWGAGGLCGGKKDGEMTLTLSPDPADSVSGLAPIEAQGRAPVPGTGSPANSPPGLGHRQRAVRQRHRVALRHQSAAALLTQGSCAAETCLRFAGREGGGVGLGVGHLGLVLRRP